MTNRNQQAIRKWMKDNVNSYFDECQVVNATKLAEDACAEFQLYDGDNFDIPELLFDMSAEIANMFDGSNRDHYDE